MALSDVMNPCYGFARNLTETEGRVLPRPRAAYPPYFRGNGPSDRLLRDASSPEDGCVTPGSSHLGHGHVNPTVLLEASMLDEIRRKARDIWSQNNRSATSYNCHFGPKDFDIQIPTRPDSPSRIHKPHPPLVFLTNRLHYIEGYQNPDITMGKDVYRVDASCVGAERARRDSLRKKYMPQLASRSLEQFRRSNSSMNEGFNLTDEQNKDTLPRMSPEYQGGRFSEILNLHPERDVLESPVFDINDPELDMRPHTAPSQLASLHRYLRHAGAQESAMLAQILDSQRIPGSSRQSSRADFYQVQPNNCPSRMSGVHAQNMYRRTPDVGAQQRSLSAAKPLCRKYYREFSMHPEWSPAMYHHRVPEKL